MVVGDELVFTIEAETATPATPIRLSEADLRERVHLQEWVKAHPQMLGEDLLLITDEFDWQNPAGQPTHERLDVLALDRTGRLVVAELIRDRAPDTVALQALTYAAMVSRFSVDHLVDLYAAESDRAASAATASRATRPPRSCAVSRAVMRQKAVNSVCQKYVSGGACSPTAVLTGGGSRPGLDRPDRAAAAGRGRALGGAGCWSGGSAAAGRRRRRRRWRRAAVQTHPGRRQGGGRPGPPATRWTPRPTGRPGAAAAGLRLGDALLGMPCLHRLWDGQAAGGCDRPHALQRGPVDNAVAFQALPRHVARRPDPADSRPLGGPHGADPDLSRELVAVEEAEIDPRVLLPSLPGQQDPVAVLGRGQAVAGPDADEPDDETADAGR